MSERAGPPRSELEPAAALDADAAPDARAALDPGDDLDTGATESVPTCYLCGTDGRLLYDDLRERVFAAPGTYALLRCPACGLIWLTPRLLPAHLRLAYASYYTHEEPRDPRRLAAVREGAQELLLEEAFASASQPPSLTRKVTARLLRGVPLVVQRTEPLILALRGRRPGKLLDVGCGDGRLLSRMERFGWRVTGVEPDPTAAERARQRIGGDVLRGSFDELDVPDAPFDAVVSSHVVEHVFDPVALLARCYDLVTPGGVLVLLTPNAGSLGHALFRSSWFPLDPPRHLYLFSMDTLATCAQRACIDGFALRTLSREAREVWQHSRAIARHGRVRDADPGLRVKVEGLLFMIAEEAGRWLRRSAGEELMLVARKPRQ